jgi:hypothetical protein
LSIWGRADSDELMLDARPAILPCCCPGRMGPYRQQMRCRRQPIRGRQMILP